MSDAQETSLFALGTNLLNRRRSILAWAAAGALATTLVVAWRPVLYEASASFAPQANDASRSGLTDLAGLAGQFGLSIFAGGQASSPDFYAGVLRSGVLLRRVVRDTLDVRELGDRKVPFLDLFEVRMAPVSSREEEGMKLLKKEIAVAVTKSTGVVQVSIRTRWPSVSLAIVSQLIGGVNDFNQRTRQSQAAAERAFLDARLETANLDLRGSEARLGEFMRANRQYANSPQLSFQHDNLQADVDLKRRLLTTLTQAYEDARIREVRDTPVITIVEPPTVSMLPEPRGRLKAVLLGFVLGGFLGVLVAFLSAVIARARMANDPAVDTFFATLKGVWRGLVPARFRRGA